MNNYLMPESINNADLWRCRDVNPVINLDMTSVMPERCVRSCMTRYAIDAPDDDLEKITIKH
jgi:hypothetical protein